MNNQKCIIVSIAAILLIVGSISGCGVAGGGLPADAFQAEADAVVAMTFAASSDDVAPAPDDSNPDRKVGDKCDNCNGTGRSGDRLSPCSVCKGDGRIDRDDIKARGTGPRLLESHEAPAPPVAPTLPTAETLPVTIELHVSQQSTSDWARAWWLNEKPFFESQLNCKVTFIKQDSAETWIQICGQSTCKRVDGQPTRDQLMAIVRSIK